MIKLSKFEIRDIATKAVADGNLSWLGFDLDDNDRYTIPILSQSHYQLVYAVLNYVADLQQNPLLQPVPCNISLDEGKYTIINNNGILSFQRYHQPWPAADELRNYNIVLAMAQRIEELEYALLAKTEV